MSSYFVDIDGVLFKMGTNTANAGAVETLKFLLSQGHKLILTTKRNTKNQDNPDLNLKATRQALQNVGLGHLEIVADVPSPRYLINDEGAYAINVLSNEPMSYLNKQIIESRNIEKKIYDSLATMIWVTTKYDNCSDADEYVQTLIIAQSLIKNRGFNHRDLVKRYASKTDFIFNNSALHEFNSGGVSKHYRGQIYRLKKSGNPLYLAKTGVTDGAAMKVLPIVAYYLFDFEALVTNTDRIVKVTHYAIEARLSAVLVVLRYRQLLLGFEDTTDDLIRDFMAAIKILGFENESHFFVNLVLKAKKITDNQQDAESLLAQLAKEIGLDYLAWSTPISACFWSFRATDEFYRFFNPKNDKVITINQTSIDANTLDKRVLSSYEKQLIKIGQYKSHLQAHGYHWKDKIDIDTFFSIAFSLVAVRDGTKKIDAASQQSIKEYGEDLHSMVQNLLFKKSSAQNFQLRKTIRLIRYSIYSFFKMLFDRMKLNLGIKAYLQRYTKPVDQELL